jgi:DNA-binding NtrC family response regulator
VERPKILLLGEHSEELEGLQRLASGNYECRWGEPHDALRDEGLLSSFRPDVIVVDLPPSRTAELEVAMGLSEFCPPLLVVRDEATSRTDVTGRSVGLFDSVRREEVLHIAISRIERILARQKLRDRIRCVRKGLYEKGAGVPEIVGQSEILLEALERAYQCAENDAPLLVMGESGTGKELLARFVHYAGRRYSEPFIPVDCGALPEHLFANEVFGHARGAYTDAREERRGLIEEADKGTLFLDEVSSMSQSNQSKLLRFLQEKEFRRLGDSQIRRADVRIIAATNLDLAAEANARRFRPDLFHRLHALSVTIPPLRERKEDIPLLARHFLAKFCRQFGKGPKGFHPSTMEKLTSYEWPGNVRELENTILRGAVTSPASEMLPDDLEITSPEQPRTGLTQSFKQAKKKIVDEFERTYVSQMLAAFGGNISRAAKAARKNRRAFWEIMKKHKIRAEDFLT